MKERSDAEWLVDLRAEGVAQADALLALRRRLVRGLSHAARRRPGLAESVVEDAAQDSLLTILGRLDTFRGDSRFLTWAMAIASRVLWTELRRRRWRDVSLNDVLAPLQNTTDNQARPLAEPTDSSAPPDLVATRADVAARLHQLIATHLTDKQRQAILAEIGGMPMAEIARRTGSNRNAIYKLAHDARRRLKTGLEEAGYAARDITALLDASNGSPP